MDEDPERRISVARQIFTPFSLPISEVFLDKIVDWEEVELRQSLIIALTKMSGICPCPERRHRYRTNYPRFGERIFMYYGKY